MATSQSAVNVQRHPSLDDRFDPAIRIVDHDPEWAERAECELRRLKRVLGPAAARLEHVGSTAVPGLAAKPILDLQVSVVAIEQLGSYIVPLEGLGYLFVTDPEWPDFPLFAKPQQRPRSYHLRLCPAGSNHELRHVALRDFLRAHPDEAARYEALKRELVRQHPQDRLAYIAGKDRYVRRLEARALEWAKRGARHGAP
jgi:GrpB-like predicted nucleotidyltransferase (UPF0157 family)